jgi:hypothetical protein
VSALQPVGPDPAEITVWTTRLTMEAPFLEAPTRNLLAFALADPRTSPDALLILADGMQEHLRQLTVPGAQYRVGLRCLIDLLRGEAPKRARPPARPRAE